MTQSTRRWRGVWSFVSTAAVVLIAVVAFAALRSSPGSPNGSAVAVRTQAPLPSSETPPPCPAAQLRGELVADEVEGVVVLEDSGLRRPVIWPHGYVARLNGGTQELLDERGEIVARQGDQIEEIRSNWAVVSMASVRTHHGWPAVDQTSSWRRPLTKRPDNFLGAPLVGRDRRPQTALDVVGSHVDVSKPCWHVRVPHAVVPEYHGPPLSPLPAKS